MKTIQIQIGDYDIKKIEGIFEKEEEFDPKCEEDAILIGVIRQCIDPSNVVADENET